MSSEQQQQQQQVQQGDQEQPTQQSIMMEQVDPSGSTGPKRNMSGSDPASGMSSNSIGAEQQQQQEEKDSQHERHLALDIGLKFLQFCGILFFLYFFLVALDVMGGAMQVMTGDAAGQLFQSVDNPLAGLCIGVLVTVLVQSSSTTTSIIVAMVGAGVMGVEQATYLVFGANIGTSVTNTIVCLTFMNNRENYRRGFAAATVHDAFNIMNVALWFPLEVISDAANGGNGGVLTLLTGAMVKNFEECDDSTSSCEKWSSPIKEWTAVIADKIIEPNKDVIKDYSYGKPAGSMCLDRLCPDNTDCAPYKFNDKRCSKSPLAVNGTVCLPDGSNKKTKAQFLFCTSATTWDQDILNAAIEHYDDGEVNKGGCFYPLQLEAGIYSFIISIFLMFASMICMIKLLNLLVRGRAEKWTKRALNMNGYLAILVGCGVTMFVQSSSITTSTLTPLAAIGTITLESMLPLTLGANIGTTFTGILASLVSDGVDGFQIALVHLMFNVFGVVLFYPIPFFRALPLKAARKLGEMAYVSKPFPALYIAFMFFLIPGVLLGLTLAFTIGGTGGIIGGSIACVVLLGLMVYSGYWYKRKGGKERISKWLDSKYGGVEAEKTEAELEKAKQAYELAEV